MVSVTSPRTRLQWESYAYFILILASICTIRCLSTAPKDLFPRMLYLPTLGPTSCICRNCTLEPKAPDTTLRIERWLTWSRPCNSLSPLNFTKTISSRQRRTRSRGSSGREVGDPGSDISKLGGGNIWEGKDQERRFATTDWVGLMSNWARMVRDFDAWAI